MLEEKVYTVSEITEKIRELIEEKFFWVSVRGEISNLDRSQRGHFYFTLKDREAQIKAVLYKGRAKRFLEHLKSGVEVICTGPITIYKPRGEYQIEVVSLERVGWGILYEEFERLKKLLEKEGLFDPEKKLPIPAVPKRIGIVTSPEGAAIRDILRVIRESGYSFHITIYPSHVQGKEAVKEIVAGIEFFNQRKDVDLIILARGGGSIEDLWAFNEEPVARAIFDSKIPIISAVGHERDYTIADFVADRRCATPTHAAEFLVKREQRIRQRLKESKRILLKQVENALSHAKKDLNILKKRLELKDPKRVVHEGMRRLDELASRMSNAAKGILWRKRRQLETASRLLDSQNPARRIERSRERLRALKERAVKATTSKLNSDRSRLNMMKSKAEALSPLAVLSRGYAICYYNNRILKRAKEVPRNALVMVELAEGAIECRVKEKRELFRSF